MWEGTVTRGGTALGAPASQQSQCLAQAAGKACDGSWDPWLVLVTASGALLGLNSESKFRFPRMAVNVEP